MLVYTYTVFPCSHMMYVCINTGFKNHFLTDLPSFILCLVPHLDSRMGQTFVHCPHHFIPSLAVCQYGKREGCCFWSSCQVVSSSARIGNITLWCLTSFSSTATMPEALLVVARVQRVNSILCPTESQPVKPLAVIAQIHQQLYLSFQFAQGSFQGLANYL